jgi:nitrate/TMAO reductase-like tetraheme cytochrome c subunit
MMARKPREPKSRVLLDVRIPGRWIVGVLVALVVVIVVAIIGFAAVNRIGTCETCHVVKPEVATYRLSAHYKAGVGCQQCHTKPGVFNYLIKNLQGVTNLILYVSNAYQRPITAVVGDVNCVQCHPNSQIEKDLVVGNIRINHAGLRAAGYQCTTCHANISHPGTRLAISRSAQNPMSICARCHDGKKLPNNCDLCHINGPPANAPKVKIPLRISPSQCTECHQKKSFCTDCHNGLQMPHPDNWIKSHGGVVIDRGKSICAECHTKKDPKFCIDCHGLQMPHPGGWLSSHGSYALDHPQKCVKCHGKDSCIKCHGLQMPHPSGWLSQHQSVALNNPSLCNKCHTSQFCINCHGVELPHSAAFIADHPNHVYNQGSVCVKCHGNMGTGPKGCYGGQCHSGSIN